MHFKNLEEKCQHYRSLTDYKLMPNSNVIAMVDGRAFSKLVKRRFELPFDDTFIQMMNETAKYVCENVQGCKVAYVQSDEISFLITDYDTPESDSFFGFRLCKMQSIIASLATAKFNQLYALNEISGRSYEKLHFDSESTLYRISDAVDYMADMPLAQFDCKVWTVPSANDAFAWFLYRQLDCIKNSKQQTAQTYLPHSQLLNKTCDEQIELLKREKDIDWTTFRDGKKFGRLIYQDLKHMVKTLDNGIVIEFDRNVWTAHDAFPLSEDDGRDKFYDIVPVLKQV